jgi:hypothetical protein
MKKQYYCQFLFLSLLVFFTNNIFSQNCTVNAGVTTTWCPGDQMKLFGNVSGLYSGTSITWSQISGPVVTIGNVNSLTTTCGTATAGATYVFRLTATCQDNTVVTNDVTYNVNPNPPAPPAANAGGNLSPGCLTWGSSITLNATAAPAGFIGTWTVVSGGTGSFSNANTPTSTFTPIQPAPADPGWTCPTTTNSYVLRWTLISTAATACPAATTTTSDDMTINVAMWNAVDARAFPPGCGNTTGNLFLYGTCRGTGTSQWTLVSGPAGYTFTPDPGQNVAVVNPPSGTYTFRYTVTAGVPVCIAGFKDVTIVVNRGGNFAVTPADANLSNLPTGACSGQPFPASRQLNANLPNVGETGTWTQVSGGTAVTFSNVNNNNATVSGMTAAGAPYKFRWTIKNTAGCNSFDEVTYRQITVLPTTTLVINSTCTPVFFSSGAHCANVSRLIITGGGSLLLSTPKNEGWYSTGFYVDSKPPNSPMPLGFNGLVAYENDFNVGGVSGVHASILSGSSCPDFGFVWRFNPNGGSNFQALELTMSSAYSQYAGAYTGTFLMKNTYCDVSLSIPYTINISKRVSPGNAGTDQNLGCNITQTNLAGNDPTVITPFYGRGSWLQISGPNTATIANINDRNTQVSNLVPGTYSFSWNINSGSTCDPSIDTVIVRVSSALPSAVSAGTNQTVCFGSTSTLTAALASAGSLANMLNTSGSTGTWSLVSQTPVGAAPTIVSPNSISTNLTGLLANTTYVFRYTAANDCGIQTSNVTITTNATQGPSQANAGINQCLAAGATTFTLGATTPTVGTGTWSKLVAANPGTITTPTSATSTVTGVNTNGVYGYIWTVSNGACAPTRDTVFISNTGPLSVPAAGSDQSICANPGVNTFTLTGTAVTNGTAVWKQISGPALASFNPNLATTMVTATVDGNYRFSRTISNGACLDISDTVIVNFYHRASSAVVNTLPTSLCANTNGVVNLVAQPLTTGTGAWSIVAGNGTIASPTSASTQATLSPGINTLRWTSSSLNAAVCPVTYDEVTISYATNALARDTAFCKATSAIIKGSHRGSGTGTWTSLTRPAGSPVVTITPQGTQDSLAAVGPLVPGVYTFRWTVVNPTCGTTFDDMTLTIDNVTDPNATTFTCDTVGSSIQLTGNTIPAGAIATWSTFSVPSGASAGSFSTPSASFTNYNTPNVAGTYNFQYQFTNGTCQIKDYVGVRVISNTNAGTNIRQCNNGSFTLNGSTLGTGEDGTWSKLNAASPGTITNTKLFNTTVTGLNPGDSINLIWTITTPEGCVKRDTVALLNLQNVVANGVPASSSYCDNLAGLDLNGSNPLTGTGSWSLVTAPAAAPAVVWTNQNTRNANVRGLTTGNYTFRYTVTNSPCATSTNDVTITSTCNVLAVLLQNFTIKESNCKAVLNWVSATEDNFKHYEVEYSKDGINFNSVGTILPKGNNSTYNFIHAADLGKSYFRLKMVDINGSINYSTMVSLNNVCSGSLVEVYPNPVKDFLAVNINGYSGKINAILFDGKGQVVTMRQLNNGRNSIVVSSLTSGIYMLSITDEMGNTSNKKIHVVH